MKKKQSLDILHKRGLIKMKQVKDIDELKVGEQFFVKIGAMHSYILIEKKGKKFKLSSRFNSGFTTSKKVLKDLIKDDKVFVE